MNEPEKCKKCGGIKEPLHCPECGQELHHVKQPTANYYMCISRHMHVETGWEDERRKYGYPPICYCDKLKQNQGDELNGDKVRSC